MILIVLSVIISIINANQILAEQMKNEVIMDNKLAMLFSKNYPHPLKMPDQNSNGTYLNESMTGDAFYEGWYQNTSRLTKRHHYFFQWRLACGWMKWTPSN